MKTIWIEFPALDIVRANKFYSVVFGHAEPEILRDDTRWITIVPGEPTVSFTQTDGFTPVPAGPLPVFDVDESLTAVVARAVAAGGTIAEEPNERPGFGFFSIIVDTEGNHIYVHSAAR